MNVSHHMDNKYSSLHPGVVCLTQWTPQLPYTEEQFINLPCPEIVVQCTNSKHLCQPLEDMKEKSLCSAPSLRDSCNISDTRNYFNVIVFVYIFQKFSLKVLFKFVYGTEWQSNFDAQSTQRTTG